MSETVIRLNIVMTYPVKWSVEHIMSDYIQNFYDMIGYENFMDAFFYQYDEDKQTLIMEGRKGFSMDWLQYIGVSTKREGRQYTAGKFGEGFKIASLCAYRDAGFTIHMESMGWSFDVTKIAGTIDNHNVEFLAYDVQERQFTDNAVLVLGNISANAYKAFLSAMNTFYYIGNPVLGKCIRCTNGFAVYHTNEKMKGKLFVRMQDRTNIAGVPLVFCNHWYQSDREDDRDRLHYSHYDTKKAVMQIIRSLTGEALKEVFFAFRQCWNQRGADRRGRIDWSDTIREMVYEIEGDEQLRKDVGNILNGTYIADISPDVIQNDRNQYRTAWAWFRSSEYHGKKKILPYYFEGLGIETLYTLCEKNDGFNVIRQPDQLQSAYIEILEELARDVFGDLICYKKIPKCRVIVNPQAPNEGLAETWRTTTVGRNVLGLKVVRTISQISIRRQLLSRNEFPYAMVTYMHELLHQFGGDASRQFHIAVLAMDRRIIEKAKELEEYNVKWLQVD